MEPNPFAAPESEVEAEVPLIEARDLEAEKDLERATSWTLFFGAASVMIAASLAFSPRQPPLWLALFGLLGAVEVPLGVALWRRDPRARLFAAASIAPVLLAFPIGTAIAGRAIAVLVRARTARLLTPEYEAVRRRDPRGAPRVGTLVVGLSGPLLLILGIGLVSWLVYRVFTPGPFLPD